MSKTTIIFPILFIIASCEETHFSTKPLSRVPATEERSSPSIGEGEDQPNPEEDQPIPAPVGGPTGIQEVVSRLGQNLSIGRVSLGALKNPMTDSLPSGVVLSGQLITVSGDGVLLENWNFDQYSIVVTGQNCTIRNNLIGEPSGVSGSSRYIDVYTSAANLKIENNDIFGFYGEGGSTVMIFQRASGSGATMQTSTGLLIRYNKFKDGDSDSIKLAGGHVVVEWNAFLVPVNINSVPSAWSATKTYNLNQYALNSSGNLFKSKSNGNIGNPVPSSKVSDGNWLSFDPHVDHITTYASIQQTTIRFNYFSRSGFDKNVTGMNNAIRMVRNTGTNSLYENLYVVGNYIEANSSLDSLGLQASDGGNPNYIGPIYMRHNWIGARSGGAYIGIATTTMIWDSNLDAVTGALISQSGVVIQSTMAPSLSDVPATVIQGYR